MFERILATGGDVVQAAAAIRDLSPPTGRYAAALRLSEMCGLSVREMTEVLRWVGGGMSDDDLRRQVRLVRTTG